MHHWIVYLTSVSVFLSIKWVGHGTVRTKEAIAYKAFRMVTETQEMLHKD